MKSIKLIPTTSAAVDILSVGYDLNDLKSCSISVVFTGTDVVGTVKLQASLDNVTWFDIPSSSDSITASSNVIYSLDPCTYRLVRVNWDYTSGTGNITADLFLKEPVVKYS